MSIRADTITIRAGILALHASVLDLCNISIFGDIKIGIEVHFDTHITKGSGNTGPYKQGTCL